MLTVRRTASSGVLLEMDGVRILLDGVCREVKPYPVTPQSVKAELMDNIPDAVVFTHHHPDHYDPAFAAEYEKLTHNKAVDPTFVGSTVQCGIVRITPVASRHIGKFDCAHASFVLEGSCCVWFMGDASPNQWKNRTDLPKPDVIIAPFAYATTDAAWKTTCTLGAKVTLLVHLPERDKDVSGLWNAVEQTIGESKNVFIPAMEEFIKIDV